MIPVIWHIDEYINDELYLSLLKQEKEYLLNMFLPVNKEKLTNLESILLKHILYEDITVDILYFNELWEHYLPKTKEIINSENFIEEFKSVYGIIGGILLTGSISSFYKNFVKMLKEDNDKRAENIIFSCHSFINTTLNENKKYLKEGKHICYGYFNPHNFEDEVFKCDDCEQWHCKDHTLEDKWDNRIEKELFLCLNCYNRI
jgi:hypothetical protein